MNKIKITPLFIVLIVVELILLFYAFYYLAIENKGGMALAGTIAFFAAIFNVVLIVIERLIVNIKGINSKWIWIIESIIIICAIVYVFKNGISIG
jgi:hypothetical protein